VKCKLVYLRHNNWEHPFLCRICRS